MRAHWSKCEAANAHARMDACARARARLCPAHTSREHTLCDRTQCAQWRGAMAAARAPAHGAAMSVRAPTKGACAGE
eukprot:1226250-Pleurochrysis_carterae.AAC.1